MASTFMYKARDDVLWGMSNETPKHEHTIILPLKLNNINQFHKQLHHPWLPLTISFLDFCNNNPDFPLITSL